MKELDKHQNQKHYFWLKSQIFEDFITKSFHQYSKWKFLLNFTTIKNIFRTIMSQVAILCY